MTCIARLRVRSGQVSATSAAPAAHSPPMPMPASACRIASSHQFCARPDKPVKHEKISTVMIMVRARPIRSVTTPNTMPPRPQATSLQARMTPPNQAMRPGSCVPINSPTQGNRINVKICRSIASNIQPRQADASVVQRAGAVCARPITEPYIYVVSPDRLGRASWMLQQRVVSHAACQSCLRIVSPYAVDILASPHKAWTVDRRTDIGARTSWREKMDA